MLGAKLPGLSKSLHLEVPTPHQLSNKWAQTTITRRGPHRRWVHQYRVRQCSLSTNQLHTRARKRHTNLAACYFHSQAPFLCCAVKWLHRHKLFIFPHSCHPKNEDWIGLIFFENRRSQLETFSHFQTGIKWSSGPKSIALGRLSTLTGFGTVINPWVTEFPILHFPSAEMHSSKEHCSV